MRCLEHSHREREELIERLMRWRTDAVAFVKEVFGASPTHQQRQLLEGVSKGQSKAWAIRSGHGTGKSACLSWLLLWFLLTRPGAKVVCTAPTRRQLFDILWAEVRMWLTKAIPAVREMVDVKSEIITVQDRRDWFARAVAVNTASSPEEQAETLAGYHHKHFLCIVDEASGVPDPVFQPIEGYLTQEDNYVVLAGNPTRPYGYFFEIFHDKTVGEMYEKLHWSSLDSPLVSQDWVDRMRRRYGEQSTAWRIRVLGEFPHSGARELIDRSLVEKAIYPVKPEKKPRPIIWGLDVARYGDDETVIVERAGPFITELWAVRQRNTMEVVDWVFGKWNSVQEKPDYICVDVSGGLGAGVADRLRELLPPGTVVDVNVSWKATRADFFFQLRDELWFRVKEALEQGFLHLCFHDGELIHQLTSVRFMEVAGGRSKVESKKELRARGLTSPDRADALCLTFFFENAAPRYRAGGMKRRPRRRVRSWKVA